ncbi:exo-1,3-beta-glucanase [Modicella reniformis]|uniref:glucan 1,3-beta-glucosidase n=1 Tax=Modicella reniformis TaxID=1440133 RepID=A0A9P6M208_9FUNG|nr:exo-1,3-beta-glucanase [Modicella reniformis]
MTQAPYRQETDLPVKPTNGAGSRTMIRVVGALVGILIKRPWFHDDNGKLSKVNSQDRYNNGNNGRDGSNTDGSSVSMFSSVQFLHATLGSAVPVRSAADPGSQPGRLAGAGALLGPEEAKAILQKHYSSWVTEETFKQIRDLGLNHVRIPLGFWALGNLEPDEP